MDGGLPAGLPGSNSKDSRYQAQAAAAAYALSRGGNGLGNSSRSLPGDSSNAAAQGEGGQRASTWAVPPLQSRQPFRQAVVKQDQPAKVQEGEGARAVRVSACGALAAAGGEDALDAIFKVRASRLPSCKRAWLALLAPPPIHMSRVTDPSRRQWPWPPIFMACSPSAPSP